MICPNCHNQVTKKDSYCPHCGAELKPTINQIKNAWTSSKERKAIKNFVKKKTLKPLIGAPLLYNFPNILNILHRHLNFRKHKHLRWCKTIHGSSHHIPNLLPIIVRWYRPFWCSPRYIKRTKTKTNRHI